MHLKDLTASQRVTLIALAHACILSDQQLSEGEEGGLQKLVKALGAAPYQAAAAVASSEITDRQSLHAAVVQVTERDARELIYGTLLELALPDGISNPEVELLELLEREWNIRAEPAGFPIDDAEEPDR